MFCRQLHLRSGTSAFVARLCAQSSANIHIIYSQIKSEEDQWLDGKPFISWKSVSSGGISFKDISITVNLRGQIASLRKRAIRQAIVPTIRFGGTEARRNRCGRSLRTPRSRLRRTGTGIFGLQFRVRKIFLLQNESFRFVLNQWNPVTAKFHSNRLRTSC